MLVSRFHIAVTLLSPLFSLFYWFFFPSPSVNPRFSMLGQTKTMSASYQPVLWLLSELVFLSSHSRFSGKIYGGCACAPLFYVPTANIVCYCLSKEYEAQSQCFLFQGYLPDLTMPNRTEFGVQRWRRLARATYRNVVYNCLKRNILRYITQS
jgi:hypothetical protein